MRSHLPPCLFFCPGAMGMSEWLHSENETHTWVDKQKKEDSSLQQHSPFVSVSIGQWQHGLGWTRAAVRAPSTFSISNPAGALGVRCADTTTERIHALKEGMHSVFSWPRPQWSLCSLRDGGDSVDNTRQEESRFHETTSTSPLRSHRSYDTQRLSHFPCLPFSPSLPYFFSCTTRETGYKMLSGGVNKRQGSGCCCCCCCC